MADHATIQETPAPSFERYGGTAPENYERYFVPAIARPVAEDLIDAAAPRAGDRVVDLACGTGVVARLAAVRVGAAGSIVGVDINPGMLAVARSVAGAGAAIDWRLADARSLPLDDESRDVVLCQMGLQFFADKVTALGEARRILAPGGRIAINVPGPTPRLFAVMEEALSRHVSPEVGRFVAAVFSLHDPSTLSGLLREAGFHDVDARARVKTLSLPAPREFLWQYVHSTPLAAAVAKLDEHARAAFERDVSTEWRPSPDGTLRLDVGITTVRALK